MNDAILSTCGRYRYMLTRGAGRLLPFLMLNPSTADASVDDPTIRRCMAFALGFGYGGILVLNLYALRATNPSDLWLASDPVGPMNDAYLQVLLYDSPVVVCAWGANARPDRVTGVIDLLRETGTQLMCLGTNKDRSPRHPLYLPKVQPMSAWNYDADAR